MKRRTFLGGAAAMLAAPVSDPRRAGPRRLRLPVLAYIAAEIPKHVALLKKAGFEAQ